MQTKEEKKAYAAAYYVANLEQKRAYGAAYRATHLEKARAYRVANQEKMKIYNKEYQAINREKRRADRIANPEKARIKDRMKRYGLSSEAFQLMLLLQKNACGICKKLFMQSRLHVDHDHKTGEVRGLLCGVCNTSLGGFKDSPEILENAKEYLRR